MARKGLFVGLVTLDFIYLAADVPHPNQKLVAADHSFAAGGPATNAAVTFRYLGNLSTLLAVVGKHPMTNLILADLDLYSVVVRDTDQRVPSASLFYYCHSRTGRAGSNFPERDQNPGQARPSCT